MFVLTIFIGVFMLHEELISKIDALEESIASMYENVRIQAIWLFLATLGCWGINQEETQIISIFIVFFLFYSKLTKKQNGNISFIKQMKDINIEVDKSSFDEEFKDSSRYELKKLERDFLKGSAFKKMPEFIVVYLFWGWSLYIFLLRY